ncbi:hypothetical protein ACLB2K_042290 [Fragaria x ananassa]
MLVHPKTCCLNPIDLSPIQITGGGHQAPGRGGIQNEVSVPLGFDKGKGPVVELLNPFKHVLSKSALSFSIPEILATDLAFQLQKFRTPPSVAVSVLVSLCKDFTSSSMLSGVKRDVSMDLGGMGKRGQFETDMMWL